MPKEKSESIAIKYVGIKGEVYISQTYTGGEPLVFKRGEVKTLPRAEWSLLLSRSSNFQEVNE